MYEFVKSMMKCYSERLFRQKISFLGGRVISVGHIDKAILLSRTHEIISFLEDRVISVGHFDQTNVSYCVWKRYRGRMDAHPSKSSLVLYCLFEREREYID